MTKKDVLIREFLKGKVSRRDFQNGLMGFGLSAAAAVALVDDTIREAKASGPVSGGTLRAAFSASSAADTLDPTLIVGGIDIGRAGLLYNRLIDYIPGKGLVGNLGTSWGANDDATRWTVELKDGVEFHNGKTLTATDVAYSFNRHLDPNGGSPRQCLSRRCRIDRDGRRPPCRLQHEGAERRHSLPPDGVSLHGPAGRSRQRELRPR